MTIVYESGNLFDKQADCIVCTVNCVGVMGKGVALQFKQRYPRMFDVYWKACREGIYHPGKPIFMKNSATDNQLICNLPTKLHWRDPSRVEWIDEGLRHLAGCSTTLKLTSVRMSKPGCGNGGLNWDKDVKHLAEKHLGPVACMFYIY